MYNFTRKNNQNQLNTLKPDFIARRGGVSFFECPIGGDESPMLAKDTGGIWFDTNIWESSRGEPSSFLGGDREESP